MVTFQYQISVKYTHISLIGTGKTENSLVTKFANSQYHQHQTDPEWSIKEKHILLLPYPIERPKPTIIIIIYNTCTSPANTRENVYCEKKVAAINRLHYGKHRNKDNKTTKCQIINTLLQASLIVNFRSEFALHSPTVHKSTFSFLSLVGCLMVIKHQALLQPTHSCPAGAPN